MNKKRILIAIVIIACLVYLINDYVFNTKHRDIVTEKATVYISAKRLFAEFLKDESLATTNYLDKVIEIKGEVTSVDDDAITLNKQIQVDFIKGKMPKLTVENSLNIKGRCVGYDELLEVVKIDQATIINK